MKSNQKKNKQKFLLLGYGRKFWIQIANIVVFLVICVGMGMFIQQHSTQNNEIKRSSALQIFMRLDDLSHQTFTGMTNFYHEMEKKESTPFTGYKEFNSLDLDFHRANTLEEKIIAAQKMSIFYQKMDIYLHQAGRLATTEALSRDKEYHTITDVFDILLQGI